MFHITSIQFNKVTNISQEKSEKLSFQLYFKVFLLARSLYKNELTTLKNNININKEINHERS